MSTYKLWGGKGDRKAEQLSAEDRKKLVKAARHKKVPSARGAFAKPHAREHGRLAWASLEDGPRRYDYAYDDLQTLKLAGPPRPLPRR